MMKDILALAKRTSGVPAEGIKLNIRSVDRVVKGGIKGAIVECGVWKGGSIAAMMYRLSQLKDTSREIYLFDTFAGMTEPTDVDKKYNSNKPAALKFKKMQRSDHNEWCYAPLNQVKTTIDAVPYPNDKVHYVVGDVLETTPRQADTISSIAILRIGVDFYEGTKVCLETLYPKVAKGGIVILDDYGIWKGAKKATDEYLKEYNIELQSVLHMRWFVKQ